MIGLDLANLVVDGCIVKAPCGGEAAGRSPVDRGKQGTKRSLLVDGQGIPLGAVVAGANRHDSPLLRPTLERLRRFDDLPDRITVHLDAGHDSRPHPRPADQTRLRSQNCDERNPRPNPGRPPVGRRANELLAQPRVQETPHLHRDTHPRHRRVHRPRQHHHHPTHHPRRMDPLPPERTTQPTTIINWRVLLVPPLGVMARLADGAISAPTSKGRIYD